MSNFPAAADEAATDPTQRYECRICWYLYDPAEGDPLEQIPTGTSFNDLPDHWRCPQCDAERLAFLQCND